MNKEISREKYIKTAVRFQQDGSSMNEKWKLIKSETGQSVRSSPQLIVENGKQKTSHIEIVAALNRQYIQKINKILGEMETSNIDPLIHYKKVVGRDDMSFTLTQINMSQLRSTLLAMKSTGCTVKLLKQAQPELEPLLLHLVNSTILTNKFPEALKVTKVVPIKKVGKDSTSSDGWRPLNVVAALSKVIERVYLKQILNHLDKHQHHGAVHGKSTQTLVNELQDLLAEDRVEGRESIRIALDQSKAYKIVCHKILLRKFEDLNPKL